MAPGSVSLLIDRVIASINQRLDKYMQLQQWEAVIREQSTF